MFRHLTFLFFSLLCIVSCISTRDGFSEQYHYSDDEILTKSFNEYNPYRVSLKEANRYASSFQELSGFEIEPLVYKGDTLMYFCNHSGGWMIISGDKRTKPIIALGHSGRISLDDVPEGILAWIDSYAEDIYSMKNSSIIENDNTKIWDMYSREQNPRDVVTKSDRWEPEMKWYAIDYGPYAISSNDVDIVPHLVSVEWGQQSPWYNECPWDASASVKCALGCIATAVAQLLHYTHYNLSKPNGLYHTVGCSVDTIYAKTSNIGFYRNNYISNSSRWDNMPTNAYGSPSAIEYAGDLMLDIGNRFGFKYSGTGSGVSSPNFSVLTNYYGLNYSHGNYDRTIVLSNLNNGLPVLITAFSERGGFLNLVYSKGHAWLIDGIHRTTTSYYYWREFEYSENWTHYSEVYDSFDEITAIYGITDPTEGVYIPGYTSSVDYLLMNWGYDGTWNNDLYSTYEDVSWPANGGGHLYRRKIYYGFN